jgi:hypothetical protein
MFQYYFLSSCFSILAAKQYKAYHAPCDLGDPRTGQSCIFQYGENQGSSRPPNPVGRGSAAIRRTMTPESVLPHVQH